jgi:hemoglobin/transferrin/lactoferrin receptor protein
MVYVAGEDELVEITLRPRPISTRVVVNATRGTAEVSASSPHLAVVKDSDDVLERPLATIGNVLEQEPGIFLQQSTYGQVSPFLRGLTGYQVLNVVDGIRYNNSTFRSGPNQYLAFIEPMQAQRVEVMLGPTASQYGSDSLGGTIQVFTPDARFSGVGSRKIRGEAVVGGATADLSSSAGAIVSAAGERLFWLGGISGRKHSDLRAGSGIDSHNVFHRLFGMPLDDVRDLIGSRQQDTGFSSHGVQTKFAARLRPDQLITINYQHGQQSRVRGYKDLLGGLGRLISDFDPQRLNWFYARYEKLDTGILDSLSAAFSLNSQTDGSLRQNLKLTDPITRDHNRVDAYGSTGQGSMHWGRRITASFGGEIYDERITSEREVRSPRTQTVIWPRPLYPDGSRYRTSGLFGQASVEVTSELRVSWSARFTSVSFRTRADSAFGVPALSQTFRDVTYHTGVTWQLTSTLGMSGVVSRGFRAPNLNDLGALGLNDLGYEIPAAETTSAGALLSTDAGEAAVSKGIPVKALSAESLMNYEIGLRVMTNRLSVRVQMFDAELYDPIVRRTLLFPADSAPAQLAGLPLAALTPTAAQSAQGVVAVATQLEPRAVKAFVNDGRSRYYGLELPARYLVNDRWTVEANYAYILGRELNPNRNVRRLPPQTGSATLRRVWPGKGAWFEVSVTAAGKQERLSGGDSDDERIGASFRRRDIADFFNGGRVARYLDSGLFVPTGETLQQIQDRVLPIGGTVNGALVVDDNTRVPLYLSTAGWAILGVRAGIRAGESGCRMTVGVENLLDHNYRHHGSGIDAPGVTAYMRVSYSF